MERWRELERRGFRRVAEIDCCWRRCLWISALALPCSSHASNEYIGFCSEIRVRRGPVTLSDAENSSVERFEGSGIPKPPSLTGRAVHCHWVGVFQSELESVLF